MIGGRGGQKRGWMPPIWEFGSASRGSEGRNEGQRGALDLGRPCTSFFTP